MYSTNFEDETKVYRVFHRATRKRKLKIEETGQEILDCGFENLDDDNNESSEEENHFAFDEGVSSMDQDNVENATFDTRNDDGTVSNKSESEDTSAKSPRENDTNNTDDDDRDDMEDYDDDDMQSDENGPDDDMKDDDDDDVYYDSEENNEKYSHLLNLVMFEQSNATVQDVVRITQAISIRFHFSDEARQTLIDFVKFLAGPEFNSLNLSKYFVAKLCKPEEEKKLYTFFCPSCNVALTNPILKKELIKMKQKVCEECGTNYPLTTCASNYFINIDMEYQLRAILADNSILNALLNRSKEIREGENNQSKEGNKLDGDKLISDVHDGEIFKSTHDAIKSDEENDVVLTASVNTDGASIFESSKNSLWSLLLAINELPTALRFKIILVAAVWWANKEPNFQIMNLYIKIFLQQMSNLIHKGIKIITSEGVKIRFRLVPINFPVDSVARPIIANRIQFNGYFGCSWCYMKGTYYINCIKYIFQKKGSTKSAKPVLRSHQEYLQDAEEAKASGKPVRGVKSLCTLADLEHFDCIWGFSTEYMHNVLLGVVRQLWETWTTMLSPSQRKIVDDLLIKIKPTKEIYRLPKILKNKGKWKAAEWLYWLLFYSIVCLKGILREDAFKSYVLFVKTMNCLLSKNISEKKLLECEKNLEKFVHDCQNIYGPGFMSFNVHILLHICESIRKSGPMWATSSYPYESKIGSLKREVTAPKGVTDQIANRTLEYSKFKITLLKMAKESPVTIFCEKVFYNKHRVLNFQRSVENAILPSYGNLKSTNIYNRCIYNQKVFHSAMYTRPTKTDNTYVMLNDGTIAQMMYFMLEGTHCKIKICKLNVRPLKLHGIKLEHILKILKRDTSYYVIPITSIKQKVIHVLGAKKTDDYICVPQEFPDVQ